MMKGMTSNLPVPINISNMWKFGSSLGLFLFVQILTGLLLASHYVADIDTAFDSVMNLSRNVSWGSMLRAIHMNGASMFFIFLYLHISRGMYYGSYNYLEVWISGFLILLLSMMTAFLGYVLPWGQMSYWGATVITNLISAVPFFGLSLVQWIWGGFSLTKASLTRFYMLHFCVPLVVSAIVVVHVYFLHKNGSQNPTNIASKYNIITFHPFFTLKDISFLFVMFLLLELLSMLNPYFLGDPENFTMANTMSTPQHIVPEWYFLPIYAILRSVPWKGAGVVCMLLSICILILPSIVPKIQSTGGWWKKGTGFNQYMQFRNWSLLISILGLMWLGGQVVMTPYIQVSQFLFGFYLVLIFTLVL